MNALLASVHSTTRPTSDMISINFIQITLKLQIITGELKFSKLAMIPCYPSYHVYQVLLRDKCDSIRCG